MKKISVIVPCHNCAEYINKCLEHIENQTIGLENIEVILVDDASTDDGKTMETLLEFERKHSENTIVVPLAENVRQGGARNAGIQYASGEYIAFCDSDDWLLYGALELLYKVAEKYDADEVEFDAFRVSTLICTDYENECESKCKEEPNITTVLDIISEEDRRRNIFRCDSTLGNWDRIYRTSLIKDNMIAFPEHVAMEEPPFTMLVRLYEKKYVRIHNHLYFVYEHENSTTQSSYDNKKFDNAYSHLMFLEEVKRRGFREIYSQEIEYFFWYWYYLNTILFAIYRNTFFTEDEYRILHETVVREVKDIGSNPYFQQNWGAVPQLANITYIDPAVVGMDTLKDLFTKLNDLCG